MSSSIFNTADKQSGEASDIDQDVPDGSQQVTMTAAEYPEDHGTRDEFSYKPVPILAPTTLFFGLISSLGLVTIFGLIPAVLGLVVGTVVLLQIRRSDGMLGGERLAQIGLAFCTLFLVGGVSWQGWNYLHEVPDGFERVSFSQDISKHKFVFKDNRFDFAPQVKALDGKRVFLKGYMYPTRTQEGLKGFLLVKDNGQCCFGGQPELADMLGAVMIEGKTADFYATKVAVAGTFQLADKKIIPAMINPKARVGVPKAAYKLVDIEHFELSKTAF